MATLKDVARLANCDVSTVSRALNNTSYVHPDTKERILKAVKELSYQPNVLSQGLKKGKRHTIGVVVPRLSMTIFAEIVQGIEERARYLGYGTLVCTTEDEPEMERECLNRLRNGFVDGIIISGTGKCNRLIRDIQGIGAIRALKEHGLSVPDDLRLVSLTGHSIGSMLETTMTSMEIPAHEIGSTAARMIITDINTPEDKKRKPQHHIFDAVWTERESS